MRSGKRREDDRALPGSLARLPVVGIIAHISRPGKGEGHALCGQGLDYCRAVALAGGAPVLIPLSLGESAWRGIYERVDGLVFPGGVDVDPAHYGEERDSHLGRVDELLDEAELLLARWALEDDLPVLAICRGIQLINVAAGGSLYQDLPTQLPDALCHACSLPEHPRDYHAHVVRFEPGTRLAGVFETGECWTNSRHHQAVKDVAPGFAITARAPDGVIEGIEKMGAPFVVGVQWHPENMAATDPKTLALFESFIEACRRETPGPPRA